MGMMCRVGIIGRTARHDCISIMILSGMLGMLGRMDLSVRIGMMCLGMIGMLGLIGSVGIFVVFVWLA